MGHFPWGEWVPTTSETAGWLRFDEPPLTNDGVLDALALVAVCDMMNGTVRERNGPGQRTWFGPSADLTVHVLGEATSEWLLASPRPARRRRLRLVGVGPVGPRPGSRGPRLSVGTVQFPT
jgi:hypothetical protein